MKPKATARQLRRGAASIALVVVLIMAEFAIVAMVLSGARDQDLSVARANSVQAFYAAEAGVNLAIRELIDDADHDGNGEVGSIADTSASQSALHGASVAVAVNIAGSDVTLTCLGIDQNARHTFVTNLDMVSGGSIGFPHGLAASADVELSGSSRVDAFDSSSGVYSPGTNSAEYATVATNTTGNDKVELKGSSRVQGDVYVGVGGNPVSVIDTSGSSLITGNRTALDEAWVMPTIPTPQNLPPSSGEYDLTGSDDDELTSGTYRFSSFETSGSTEVRITGDVTIYLDGTLELKGSSEIILNPGATLTVFAPKFEFSGSTKLNMPGSPTPVVPGNVTLYQTSTSAFETKGSSKVAATILAPDSKFEMSGSTRFFGAAQVAKVEMKGSSRFTQDLAITGQSSGGSGSGGSSSVVMSGWSQVPPQ